MYSLSSFNCSWINHHRNGPLECLPRGPSILFIDSQTLIKYLFTTLLSYNLFLSVSYSFLGALSRLRWPTEALGWFIKKSLSEAALGKRKTHVTCYSWVRVNLLSLFLFLGISDTSWQSSSPICHPFSPWQSPCPMCKVLFFMDI